MIIPKLLLQRLYTFSSLKNVGSSVQLSVKNRLSDVQLTGIESICIDQNRLNADHIRLVIAGDQRVIKARQVGPDNPLDFPLRQSVDILLDIPPLPLGKHKIEFQFDTAPFGRLVFDVEDTISEDQPDRVRIPRDKNDDYAQEIIDQRRQFVEEYTGSRLLHTTKYSFDPHETIGNIENFTGVAQVPIGFSGPLHIEGEHAQGDFLIPLATTEGTLVASYNRGMKVLNLCGGVKCTVIGDAMQRAPVFIFDSAREGREFVRWIRENIDPIREEAEATSSVARLVDIDPYLASKFVFLRFNYTTGDAAGQNMVGRATFAACGWIIERYPGIRHFYLESNFATDKKASQVNVMRTRGKRVTAEALVKRDVLIQHLRVEPESLVYHYGVANVGSILSGANNNGLHSANAITALFIATGQDVANVAESSAGIIYVEMTQEGDLYVSLTIPSLIVATYGGGTGLPTQKECLQALGCYGKGKVNKLAEIVTGAAAAGELSLAAAISSSDWVSSHERYGRNR
ncbi:MAG: hydroxymethylglutaryl-CoA reductase [Anaerolineales bacterium]|nr:hydroxymethylglutaryl-CoA reductase [Anaerolineales bacterium]